MRRLSVVKDDSTVQGSSIGDWGNFRFGRCRPIRVIGSTIEGSGVDGHSVTISVVERPGLVNRLMQHTKVDLDLYSNAEKQSVGDISTLEGSVCGKRSTPLPRTCKA